VTVILNGTAIIDSNIQGRFILEKMKEGEYSIKLIKKGYETLEETFHYDPLQVLYFKMINCRELTALAEASLTEALIDNTEFKAAENYLDRALLLEPDRPDLLFLKSICFYLQARYAEAADILETIIKSGSNFPSVLQLRERIGRLD
ncbi:MAG: tetratricopeptide repeat protein, partial [Treponema sp.]|nr:tetratricopeptide repeat protein [Treponema sp.]